MPGSTPQAEQLRADLRVLTGQADRHVAAAFARVTNPDTARDGLAEALRPLVALYGSAAGTVAADWYDEQRAAASVRGRFRAVPAEIPDDDAGVEALAGWAIGPLFQAEPDRASALTLLQGGLSRRVLNVARDTVTGSSVADPAATGWQRVGAGECAFCRMLIGRGAVYTEASADFASHDHCHCAATPAWNGEPRPVKPYTPSARRINDADRARVRDYLRTN